jgi:hypothetical protein
VTEGDVPESYTLGNVLAYVARQSFMLALVLPLAVLGALYWATPFLVTQRIAFSFRPELDQIATYKVGVGSVSFLVWLGATCGLVWMLSGTTAAAVVGLVAPFVGLAAVAWKEREVTVREDVRVFFRSRRRSQSEDRLAEQRAALVAEIDAIVLESQSVGASGAGA